VVGVSREVFVARVIADGRVTVPQRVRDVLGVKKGDYLRVSIIEVIKKPEQKKLGRESK